jgi:hypothetical protein
VISRASRLHSGARRSEPSACSSAFIVPLHDSVRMSALRGKAQHINAKITNSIRDMACSAKEPKAEANLTNRSAKQCELAHIPLAICIVHTDAGK